MKTGHHFSPKFGFTGSAGKTPVRPRMRAPGVKLPSMAGVAAPVPKNPLTRKER